VRVLTRARAIAVRRCGTHAIATAVLRAHALIAFLARPAFLTHALEVIAASVRSALAAQFAAVCAFVLRCAAASSVEALAVLGAIIRTGKLRAVILRVLRHALADTIVAPTVIAAVVLAESDLASGTSVQVITLAGAVEAVAVAMTVLVTRLLLTGLAKIARQARARALFIITDLSDGESAAVAAFCRVGLSLAAGTVEALFAFALAVNLALAVMRAVGCTSHLRAVAARHETLIARAQASRVVAHTIAAAVLGAHQTAAVLAGEAGVALAICRAARLTLAVNALAMERAIIEAASG